MSQDLTNTSYVSGTYNGSELSLTSDALVVTMVSGLTIALTANKEVWADGVLIYTVTIDNQTTTSYDSPVLTDTLDISLVDFVTDSVTVNGSSTSNYTYESSTGLLTVNLDSIAASSSSVVTFRVSKKTS